MKGAGSYLVGIRGAGIAFDKVETTKRTRLEVPAGLVQHELVELIGASAILHLREDAFAIAGAERVCRAVLGAAIRAFGDEVGALLVGRRV